MIPTCEKVLCNAAKIRGGGGGGGGGERIFEIAVFYLFVAIT